MPGVAHAARDRVPSRFAGVRATERRALCRRRVGPLAADGPPGADESRRQRGDLSFAAGDSPAEVHTCGGVIMQAARLHSYREALRLAEVDEPKEGGPFEW